MVRRSKSGLRLSGDSSIHTSGIRSLLLDRILVVGRCRVSHELISKRVVVVVIIVFDVINESMSSSW
jgi:hypothetical protein